MAPRRSTKRIISRSDDLAAMGDGSIPSEFIAAARRLIGLTYRDERNTFLRHLLVSAAVDLKFKAKAAAFDARAIAVLSARGWRQTRAAAKRMLRAGDLIVFEEVADLDGDGRLDPMSLVAVVESVSHSGVATCIGPVFGRISRFALSLKYPKARRNEATAEVLNDRIRGPRVTASGRSADALAGELFLVALRPRVR